MSSFFSFHFKIRENPRIFRDEDLFFGPHSRIRGIKLFVPPQNLFMPPSHAILAPGMTCRSQRRFFCDIPP